ncbi:NAD(P)H-dependent oxidoreductase [Ruania zhangjianzhongii]|uniref:NAD(P)H-dependent oxidoreductase n=1 Tax=Ruania zhangjianzhongii TaxID=2603206 RepID=UPI0016527554|nr:NAD(P)H-dependent oxidoreductase [Ruania zhangjianzhongii]
MHPSHLNQNTEPRTVLWVSAHPEPASLTASLARSGAQTLREQGHEVLTSDLYAMGWDAVVRRDNLDRRGLTGRVEVTRHGRAAYLEDALTEDVAREQDKLRRADALVIQFPLWWYGMPAILKGWFDRVFVSGFAFGSDPVTGRRLRFEQGPFRGMRALAVITAGDRPGALGPRGISGPPTELFYGLLHGTFAYTGMSALQPWILPSADFTSEEGFSAVRDSLATRLKGLFDEEPISYREQFTGDYTEDWELHPHVAPGRTGLAAHLCA